MANTADTKYGRGVGLKRVPGVYPQGESSRKPVTVGELCDPHLPHVVRSLAELVSPATDWIASWKGPGVNSATRKSILNEISDPGFLCSPASITRR